jgi:hypothetical protein
MLWHNCFTPFYIEGGQLRFRLHQRLLDCSCLAKLAEQFRTQQGRVWSSKIPRVLCVITSLKHIEANVLGNRSHRVRLRVTLPMVTSVFCILLNTANSGRFSLGLQCDQNNPPVLQRELPAGLVQCHPGKESSRFMRTDQIMGMAFTSYHACAERVPGFPKHCGQHRDVCVRYQQRTMGPGASPGG